MFQMCVVLLHNIIVVPCCWGALYCCTRLILEKGHLQRVVHMLLVLPVSVDMRSLGLPLPLGLCKGLPGPTFHLHGAQEIAQLGLKLDISAPQKGRMEVLWFREGSLQEGSSIIRVSSI